MSLERRINSVYIKSGLWLRPMRKKAETPGTARANLVQGSRLPAPTRNPSGKWSDGAYESPTSLRSHVQNFGRGLNNAAKSVIPHTLGGTARHDQGLERFRRLGSNTLNDVTGGMVGEPSGVPLGVPVNNPYMPDSSISATYRPAGSEQSPLMWGIGVGGLAGAKGVLNATGNMMAKTRNTTEEISRAQRRVDELKKIWEEAKVSHTEASNALSSLGSRPAKATVDLANRGYNQATDVLNTAQKNYDAARVAAAEAEAARLGRGEQTVNYINAGINGALRDGLLWGGSAAGAAGAYNAMTQAAPEEHWLDTSVDPDSY